MNPSTLRAIALIAAVGGLIGFGFWLGYNIADGRCTKKEAAAAQTQVKRMASTAQRTDQQDAAYSASQEKNRATGRTITREVIRYVALPSTAATDCQLDDDGLRLLIAGARGVPPETVERLPDALPGAPGTEGPHGKDAGAPDGH